MITTSQIVSSALRAATMLEAADRSDRNAADLPYAACAAELRRIAAGLQAAKAATATGTVELFEKIAGLGHPLELMEPQALPIIQAALIEMFALGQDSQAQSD